MKTTVGETLAALRRENRLMQKDVAAKLTAFGFNVSAKTIYNWEKGLAQPSIQVFLALCDIFNVDDILWRFAGIHKGPYAGLNQAGRNKARELTDLLLQIDTFTESSQDVKASVNSSPDAKASVKSSPDAFYAPEESIIAPRLLRLYEITVSAGTGNFLDESGYEMIESPGYVPSSADFALRVSGDSMEPLIRDGQVIWVKEQDVLNTGEIGVFIYSGDVYCKKLVKNDGKAYLRSLNSGYDDIEINEDFGLKVIGKVVS